MKHPIKTWTLRLMATGLLVAALLFAIILNPGLVYAHKTTYKHLTIYHDRPLSPTLIDKFNQAAALVAASSVHNPKLTLDICLHDNSVYPQLMQSLRGPAFAWGFYNKVVLQGTAHVDSNYVELNGYRWNMTQLLAHEMTHCYQFNQLGFWNSKPIAPIPNWKWEGYAEYVSRQNTDQKDLSKNLARLMETDESQWGVKFSDHTITPRAYYDHWTLVQYCLEVKQMNYLQMLADTTRESSIRAEMMCWFNRPEILSTPSPIQNR
ncbi:MAG: hypothetical protein JNL40_03980 [Cyclobacteriaceae bacterium]|nr:hypothetical protein [Cyclobacteriaceae bacterium]